MNKALIIFLSLVFLVSCNRSSKKAEDIPLARVNDKYLFKSQLQNIIPDNISSADSARIVTDHIDKWIRKQLIVAQAEKNLSDEEKNVENQIEDYRSSLLIFKYEQNFIRHRMDTNVTDQQIVEYFNSNTPNFILNSNIAKGIFVQVARSAPDVSSVRRWYKSNSPEDLNKLESYCFHNATKYEYFDEDWRYFSEVYQNLPETYQRPENILRYRKNYEVKDTNFYYLVKISDFKLAGSVAPIDFVSDDIRNILLNKRRIQMIQELESDIYKDALNHDQFNIY